MKRLLAVLLATSIFQLLAPSILHAQDDDFGMDFSLSAEKKLRPGMSFSIEGEARTQDNTSKIERWTAGGTFGMRLFQTSDKKFNLKASAGWKYMWRYNLSEITDKYDENIIITPEGTTTESYWKGYNEKSSYWRNRHRASIGLSASYKLNKRWSFSLKETFQYTHFCKGSTTVSKFRLEDEDDKESLYLKEPITSKDYKGKDRTVLRSKLTTQYNIRHCPANPYASVDYGCGLNYTTNKWKFTAGTDINLSKNKQHKLDVFYRFITEDDEEDPNGHLIGIGYQFKF